MSMEQERFSFLELPGNEQKSQHGSHNSYSVPDIPDNQHLNYLDLLALKPTRDALKRVSLRLVEKYHFIPIATQPAALPLRLPGSLDPQFHIHWKMGSGQIFYLAICPPEKELVLQFIYNAVGQGLYGIPIKPETFARFMQDKYQELRKS